MQLALKATDRGEPARWGFLLIHRAIEWIQTFSVLYVTCHSTNGKVVIEQKLGRPIRASILAV
jgi:hypothetical protein